jgi:hypothetical protein
MALHGLFQPVVWWRRIQQRVHESDPVVLAQLDPLVFTRRVFRPQNLFSAM